jgi:hypothetical protein
VRYYGDWLALGYMSANLVGENSGAVGDGGGWRYGGDVMGDRSTGQGFGDAMPVVYWW